MPQLTQRKIDLLLIDVQQAPGLSVLERFNFSTTPAYIIYDGAGNERLRTAITPTLQTIEESLP